MTNQDLNMHFWQLLFCQHDKPDNAQALNEDYLDFSQLHRKASPLDFWTP